jgi:hypothetical protein
MWVVQRKFWHSYVWNLLISIDQLVNTIFGGHPDETISSRCGKRLPHCTFCRRLCRFLDRIEYRHCVRSIEEDEGHESV